MRHPFTSGVRALERVEKATVILFGGTGDLATRKLLPALFNLWKEGALKDALIVAVGRRVKDREAYHEMLRESVGVASAEAEDWSRFVENVDYHRGEIQTEADFDSLRQHLERLEKQRQLPGNRLFYYAVGPNWFAPITQRLSKAGLVPRPSESPEGRWARIVVEKPFGHDLDSAIELDRDLHANVDESQIYRIDHYLGKETVQNLLAFRFANGLFEPTWNRKYVDSVQITVAEAVGVEDRADYYEKSGALRDMMQNHMLQLLALTAMEPPNSLDATALRNEKVKALQSIRLPENPQEVDHSTARGQYGPGVVGDDAMPGYREEPGVGEDSTTPTFVAARLYLDSWRWAGVPFLLRHGKRLPKRATEIAIQFRTPPLALFRGTAIAGQCTNLLMLRVQPNEGISLRFAAKVPGAGMKIENVQMNFSYEDSFDTRIPEAYERLILDALLGDPSLFTRSDEVQAMWCWADTLLTAWDELGAPNFPNYPAGSWGPKEANCLWPAGADVPPGFVPGWLATVLVRVNAPI